MNNKDLPANEMGGLVARGDAGRLAKIVTWETDYLKNWGNKLDLGQPFSIFFAQSAAGLKESETIPKSP
jgi:hypothetical protein